MSLGAMTPEVAARFDRVCELIALRGEGMSLKDLGGAHALARELSGTEPDPERVRELAGSLGLDPDDLHR